jgi:hypothetical protein
MNGSVTDKLRRLAALPEAKLPFLSVYLDTKLAAPEKRAELRIFLKNAIRDAGTILDGRENRESFEKDADRLLRFVDEELHAAEHAPGHAIFACAGAGVFEVIRAPRPFEDQLLVSNRPLVRQLAVMLDRYEPVVAVVVDSRVARVFEISLANGVTEHDIEGDVPRNAKVPEFHGWGDLKYQRDLKGHIEHHWRDVGEYLGRLYARGFRRVVLLGQDQVVQNFRKALPKRVEECVMASAPMDRRETRDRIVARAIEIVRQEERRHEAELVALIRDQALSGNLGVFGLEATVNALRKGQVHKLAIAADLRVRGWRCRACAALATHLKADACPHCGGATEVVELGDEVVKDAIGQGAEIVTLAANEELARMGKIAALLRFRD